jgi:hypothetical protein
MLMSENKKTTEERTQELKQKLGIAYWPLVCLVYPIAFLAVFNMQNPKTAALLEILMAANIAVFLLKA